jgi:acyl-CoA synthetase (AMP-forming)/AMP-acid ligase II
MTRDVPSTLQEVATLGDLTRFHAIARPAKEAMVFEGRSTSYGVLDCHANQVANGLLADGLEPGARVAFMDKNSDHFYEIVFGCAKSGTVSVGINWRLAPPEVAYILNDSQAEILFVGPDFYALAEQHSRSGADAEAHRRHGPGP